MDFLYQYYKMIQCLSVISWFIAQAFGFYNLFTDSLMYSAIYPCVLLDPVGSTMMNETWT